MHIIIIIIIIIISCLTLVLGMEFQKKETKRKIEGWIECQKTTMPVYIALQAIFMHHRNNICASLFVTLT